MKIRVYYEDTDAGGIVYHTNYIKYCERARSEVFFALDKSPLSGDSGFVVRDIKASFLASATLGDILEIKSTLLSLKRSYLWLLQDIYRGDTLVFSMEIKLVYMTKSRAIRIPEDFVDILNNF